MFKKLLPLLFLFAGFQANALVITQYTSETAFQAAAGALSIEDFSGELDGSFTSRTFTGFDASLANAAYYDFPSVVSNELLIQYSESGNILNLTFVSGIDALGFKWSNTDTFAADDVIELVIGGQSFEFGPSGSGFFGITTDNAFSIAGFSITYVDCEGCAWMDLFIDDIRFGVSAVPEPSIIALFALGLVGIGFARRRRQA
jgi:hypothetical protein